MEEITKEDIFMLISSSAKDKLDFIWPDEDDPDFLTSEEFETYVTDDGREYNKWDTPVFLMLNGVMSNQDKQWVINLCCAQMMLRGFTPDVKKIEKVYQTIRRDCQDEVNALSYAMNRFEMDDDYLEILNSVKYML